MDTCVTRPLPKRGDWARIYIQAGMWEESMEVWLVEIVEREDTGEMWRVRDAEGAEFDWWFPTGNAASNQ